MTSRDHLNVHLACGGTGGHIFPGLATADVLRGRGHEVTIWMAGKDVEGEALKGWSGRVVTVPAEGLPSGFSPRAVSGGWRLLRAVRTCRKRMSASRPDALLAMGAYASVGPAFAALRLRVPVVLHESNVVPGRAIGLFSPWADAVAAAFEETRYHLRRREIVVTGMPLRRDLARRRPTSAGRPRPKGPFTLLVMGGSRGARWLNTQATAAAAAVVHDGGLLRVVHLAGTADEAAVREAYARAGVEHGVHAFHHDMASLYEEADLAVCRAGASTCAELLAFHVPALLVPYPHATRRHQLANARAMERLGVAHAVEEPHCTADWLAEYLAGMMCAPERLERMRRAAAHQAAGDAAVALADLVERTAAARRNGKGRTR